MAEKSPPVSNREPVETTTFDEPPHRIEARAELRAARRAGTRWRLISRWLGLSIFIFGAILLVYVFWQALSGLGRFSDPNRLNIEFNNFIGKDNSAPAVISAVVRFFGNELLRVLYLLILGFIASAIAARGIQFFAASESVIDEAVLPED